MSETKEKDAETPVRASYVETPPPTAEETEPPTPAAPNPKYPLIEAIKELTKAVQAKEQQLSHHLDRIASAVEKIAKMQPQGIVPLAPAPKPQAPAAPALVPVPTPTPTEQSFFVATQAEFPQDLQDMLLFEDKGDYIRIKPRQYLGSENFAKIAAIVRDIGGEYVSAGKDSHFRRAK